MIKSSLQNSHNDYIKKTKIIKLSHLAKTEKLIKNEKPLIILSGKSLEVW